MKRVVSALSVVLLLTTVTCAVSAELKILTSRAITTVLQEVGGEFERTTGHKLNVVTGLSGTFVKAINAGEPFDIFAGPPPGVDALIKAGKLAADSRTPLVRSDVGVEVRAGAPKPDISTVEAFKQAILNAKSITYLPVPGVPQMLERLGVAEAVKAKSVVPDTDIVSELVAEGKVEIGLVVITQILTTHGVELVGPLPDELKITTSFAGGVSAESKAPEAARALIAFLKRPETVKVMRAQGMEPLF